MSATGPSAFVVVGDTDWLSVSLRNASTAYDSRLREYLNISTSGGWRGQLSANNRTPTETPIYFECLITGAYVSDPNSFALGVVLDSEASAADGQFPGLATNSIGYLGSGNIYRANTLQQSGLSTYTTGDVIGFRLRLYSGAVKVQAYKNGAAIGTEESVSSGAYRVFLAGFYQDNRVRFLCDAAELRYLPAGAQPWGAAARVSDAGGYSPAATKFTAAGGVISLDSFKRTATDTTTATDMAIAAEAPKVLNKSGYRAFGILIEVDSGTTGYVGLALRTALTSLIPGEVAAGGGSFYTQDGRKFTGGSLTAYGSGATAGQWVTVIYHCPTGKVWFAVNSTVQASGNPQALTGEAFTLSGDVVPAVTPYQSRMRLATHALEWPYCPSYCEAWDGADLLPEQYHSDKIEAATYLRAVQLGPGNGSGGGSSEPVGSIDLINTGRDFEGLRDWDLRDQAVDCYRIRSDGTLRRDWSGVFDSIDRGDADILRVLVSDGTGELDVRIDADLIVLGTVGYAGAIAKQDTALTYELCQTPLFDFDTLYDGGAAVTTWRRFCYSSGDPSEHTGRIQRTIAPDRKHAVSDLATYDNYGEASASNLTLNAWTGNTPDNWSKTESGTGSVTSSGGTAARIQGGGTGSDKIGLHKTGFTMPTFGSGDSVFGTAWRYFIGLKISANTSGDLIVALEESAGDYINGTGYSEATTAKIEGGSTGWYFVKVPDISTDCNYLSIYADQSGTSVDITIDEVKVFECFNTYGYTFLYFLGGVDIFSHDIALETSSVSGGAYGWGLLRAGLSSSAVPALSHRSADRPTLRQMVEAAASRAFGDYYVDAAGRLRITYLAEVDAVQTTDGLYLGTVEESELMGDTSVEDDLAPYLSDRFAYPNHAKHSSDAELVGSASTTVRAALQADAFIQKLDLSSIGASDAQPFHRFYNHALNREALELPLYANADNLAASPVPGTGPEAPIRLHRVYKDRQQFADILIKLDKADELADAAADVVGPDGGLPCGGVFALTDSSINYSAQAVQIESIRLDFGSPTVALRVRGPK